MKKKNIMLLALFFIIPNVNVNKANMEKLTIYHCGPEDVFVPNQNNNENNNYEMLDYLNNNGTNLEINPSINFGTLESSYYLQKDFIYYYFYNQGKNIIENQLGNCGLTAISMLLSYYDIYWNDDIIPNQYNIGTNLSSSDDMITSYDSPGITDDIKFENNGESFSESIKSFINIAILNKDTSFMGLLLDYAVNQGYFTKDDIESLGVNYLMMMSLLDKYLMSNPILLEHAKLKSLHVGVDDTEYRRFYLMGTIKNLLIEGHPLIVGGNGVDSSGIKYGHVCIAYDYDQKNDIIYGNMGWGKGTVTIDGVYYPSTRVNLNAYFNNGIEDYYYYEFDDNLTHKHSNKYYILSTNEYVCSCQLNSHTHSYAYLFSTFTYHKKKCICMEDYELEKHNYSIKGEFLVCSNCGASKPYIHLEI